MSEDTHQVPEGTDPLTSEPGLSHLPDEDPSPPGALRLLRMLLLSSVHLFLDHLSTLMLIVLVRLVPFYVLLHLVPITDPFIDALVETAVAVPAVAALVRYVWGIVIGVHVSREDALLGGSPSATLRLLGANLFILAATFMTGVGGPAIFFLSMFAMAWVTLLTDQTVIIEGRTVLDAITRSFHLVRPSWRLTLAVLAILWTPELGGMFLYRSLTTGLLREVASRAVSATVLPFAAVCLTLLYHHLFDEEMRSARLAGHGGDSRPNEGEAEP